MTCNGCRSISRVFGVIRRPQPKPAGLFPNGLARRQRNKHVLFSLIILALGGALIWVGVRGTNWMGDQITQWMIGQ